MLGFSSTQSRTLHLTWIAFFLTFVAWFNMAPFNTTIINQLGLTQTEVNILMICNVVLTIPARIVIGSLTDQYGPQKVFSGLLLFSGLVCIAFSLCKSFEGLLITRLLMGIVGGGFVVGIKMIAEWFPHNKMGLAQGIYAGWGNFGAAAAAFSLPLIALPFSIDIGWRIATAFSGVLCIIWGYVYFRFCPDIPERSHDFEMAIHGTIKVYSRKDLLLQSLVLLPIYGSLALFVWKLAGHPFTLIPSSLSWLLISGLLGIFAIQVIRCWQINLPDIKQGEPRLRKIFIQPDRYFEHGLLPYLRFRVGYRFNFPAISGNYFFPFSRDGRNARSQLCFMNLIARPGGGWASDRFGRKQILILLVLCGMVTHGFIGEINSTWQLPNAIALVLIGSIFFKAGNGACFAAVPLVKKKPNRPISWINWSLWKCRVQFFS